MCNPSGDPPSHRSNVYFVHVRTDWYFLQRFDSVAGITRSYTPVARAIELSHAACEYSVRRSARGVFFNFQKNTGATAVPGMRRLSQLDSGPVCRVVLGFETWKIDPIGRRGTPQETLAW